MRACVCGGRGRRRGVFPSGVETDDLFLVEVQMAVDQTRDVSEGRAVVVGCEIGIDLAACDKQVGRIELKVVADQSVDISRSKYTCCMNLFKTHVYL